jgi:hypothetical protein
VRSGLFDSDQIPTEIFETNKSTAHFNLPAFSATSLIRQR